MALAIVWCLARAYPDSTKSSCATKMGGTYLILLHQFPQTARSAADVFLFGANVTSWKVSNGSEVLYLRDDSGLDGVNPIRQAHVVCVHLSVSLLLFSGGIPICWPRFPTAPPLEEDVDVPNHGFADAFLWDILETVRLCIMPFETMLTRERVSLQNPNRLCASNCAARQPAVHCGTTRSSLSIVCCWALDSWG